MMLWVDLERVVLGMCVILNLVIKNLDREAYSIDSGKMASYWRVLVKAGLFSFKTSPLCK